MVTAEKALIAKIRRMAKSGKKSALRTGIGDDCAVLSLSPVLGRATETLVTTDFSLEGVHFRREWHSPQSIGLRCLARGLSDIAAMGGTPVAAFLSLALPRHLPQSWVNHFARSLIGMAKRYGVVLAGGDTAESPNGILADIVVVGAAPQGESVMRSGARPDDLIYLSGDLGGSAAAARLMQKQNKGSSRKFNPQDYPRHFFPEPRVALGRILRVKGLASSMIDTSDGLSTDLAHICEESRVGAEIHADLIPRAEVGNPPRKVDLQLSLHGGEDYELLFTTRPGKAVPSRIAGVPITQIGRITRRRKILLVNRAGVAHELKPQGWEHFRR